MTLIRHDGRRGPTWAFRFWYRGRLYQAKGFPTEGLAKDALKKERRRVEEAVHEAQWGPVRPRLTRWAEVRERYAHAKSGRKASLRDDLARLAWWVAFLEGRGVHYLQAVAPDAVDDGRRQLEADGRAPQTVKHYLGLLRHVFELARRRWRLVSTNPVLQVELPTVVPKASRVPTPDERRRLLASAEAVIRPLIVVAIYTGLREGAIMALTAERFTETPGWLHALDEKGDREYWIPVAAPLAELVRSLGIIKGPLWRKSSGEVQRWFPRKAWERSLAAAGLAEKRETPYVDARGTARVRVTWRPRLRFHDLRHLVGTVLVEAGVPVRVVQRFLGHSKIATTERYTRPTDPALVDAVRILERTFGALTADRR